MCVKAIASQTWDIFWDKLYSYFYTHFAEPTDLAW